MKDDIALENGINIKGYYLRFMSECAVLVKVIFL
jgi:hypothetical protein